MRITPADPADQTLTQALFEVLIAADAVNDPHGPPWSLRRLRGWLEHPDEPAQTWAADDETGTVVGWYYLALPVRENRDRAYLHLTVHPAARRRGTGTALLRHAAARVAADGRVILGGAALQRSAGAAFAERAGATAGLADARRVQRLDQLPDGRVARLRAQAAAAATGYSLLRWDGVIPEEYLAGYAGVKQAMEDAPHDPGWEHWVWNTDRVREQQEIRARQGRHVYLIAARHDASGALAALTEVETDQDNPRWCYQLLTAVVREHRGHRLGLLVKTAMLDWLAQAEPAVDRIVTGNAAVNRHMIAINEELGYQLLPPLAVGYELTAAAVLAGPA